MDPAQQWHMTNTTPQVPLPYYLVVELNSKKSSIFDSRFNKSFEVHDEGKRQMLVAYMRENQISDIITIYEVLLPANRSQIICWYRI